MSFVTFNDLKMCAGQIFGFKEVNETDKLKYYDRTFIGTKRKGSLVF